MKEDYKWIAWQLSYSLLYVCLWEYIKKVFSVMKYTPMAWLTVHSTIRHVVGYRGDAVLTNLSGREENVLLIYFHWINQSIILNRHRRFCLRQTVGKRYENPILLVARRREKEKDETGKKNDMENIVTK